jgi:hypothetical protein
LASAPDRGAGRPRVRDVQRLAAADLEVDDLESLAGELAGMVADLVRPVALDKAEIGDLVAHRPAQQPMHRLTQRLAEGVPQGDLDPRQDLV